MLSSFIARCSSSKFSGHLSRFQESIFVGWHINDVCNFNCAYCHQVKVDRRHKRWENTVLCDRFCRLGRSLVINISGGEPFLYPGFVELCALLTRHHYISINTNLSTSNIYEFADRIDPSRVLYLTASLHIQERVRRHHGVRDYLDKVLYLQMKQFDVRANYVAHPFLLPQIRQDVDRLRKAGVLDFQVETFNGRHRGRSYPHSYSYDERLMLTELGMDCDDLAVLENSHGFRGRLCLAGIKSFSLHPDGQLFRCNQSHRPYGNLFAGNFWSDRRPRPCPFLTCVCPIYGMVNALEARAEHLYVLCENLSERLLKWRNRAVACLMNPLQTMQKLNRRLASSRLGGAMARTRR